MTASAECPLTGAHSPDLVSAPGTPKAPLAEFQDNLEAMGAALGATRDDGPPDAGDLVYLQTILPIVEGWLKARSLLNV